MSEMTKRKKEGCVWRHEWELAKHLPDSEKDTFIMSLAKYRLDGVVPEDDGSMTYRLIRSIIRKEQEDAQ